MRELSAAKPGVIEKSLSNEDYHALPALSSSQLKYAYNNIEMFERAVLLKLVKHKSSKAFKTGTLFHELVLEPEIYNPKVYPHKKLDKRTKEYKDFVRDLDKVQISNIISYEEEDKLNAMFDGLQEHPDAPDFSKLQNESSVFYSWKGREFRTRPDALCFDTQTIYDLKTTASPVGKYDFLYHLEKYDYDLSAAMYIHSMSTMTGVPWSFSFVVTQTVEPYSTVVYEVGESLFYQGFNKYEKAIANIEKAEKSGLYKKQTSSQVLESRRDVDKFNAINYYK